MKKGKPIQKHERRNPEGEGEDEGILIQEMDVKQLARWRRREKIKEEE